MNAMKDNFFNNYILPIIRVINVILLVLFGLALSASSVLKDKSLIEVNGYVWLIVLGVSPFLSSIIKYVIESKHEFYEWDKKEREKRKHFIDLLTLVVFCFTYLSVFILAITLHDFKHIEFKDLSNPDIFDFSIRFIYGIAFFLNSIFTIPLHYRIYSEYLTIDNYSLAKKPNNWEWERTSADDIHDFMNGTL